MEFSDFDLFEDTLLDLLTLEDDKKSSIKPNLPSTNYIIKLEPSNRILTRLPLMQLKSFSFNVNKGINAGDFDLIRNTFHECVHDRCIFRIMNNYQPGDNLGKLDLINYYKSLIHSFPDGIGQELKTTKILDKNITAIKQKLKFSGTRLTTYFDEMKYYYPNETELTDNELLKTIIIDSEQHDTLFRCDFKVYVRIISDNVTNKIIVYEIGIKLKSLKPNLAVN